MSFGINEIISYRQMCNNENAVVIQRGMNFHLNNSFSVILMSVQKDAPYNDKIEDDEKL